MIGGGAGDVRATYADPVVARGWDARRSRSLFEAAWLRRACDGLGPGAPVLDLGCGAGDPIGAWLIAGGFDVVGVDASPAMLALARTRMPGATLVEADMRGLDLRRRFDAVIAWDSFFHLSPAARRRTIRRVADHLNPGGRFLATVGPRASEAVGRVGPVGGERPIYHASLSVADYAATLDDSGLDLRAFVAEDPSCGGHSVVLARRR